MIRSLLDANNVGYWVDEQAISLDGSPETVVINYYTHTQAVWRLVQKAVKEGSKFSVRNLTTGTVVDEQVLLTLAQQYITEYHTWFTFQHFVSLFEDWLFDLLRLWLSSI